MMSVVSQSVAHASRPSFISFTNYDPHAKRLPSGNPKDFIQLTPPITVQTLIYEDLHV